MDLLILRLYLKFGKNEQVCYNIVNKYMGGNMKKSTIGIISTIFIVMSVFCTVFAANNTKFSSRFVKNFKDCDNYTETITSEFENRSFTTTRHILGWRNGMCRYEETIASPTDSYKLSCNFSAIQVEELYNAMKSKYNSIEKYDLETFAEQRDEKTGQVKYVTNAVQTIKGNKAYITWAKYQNNPYFCKPQKLK